MRRGSLVPIVAFLLPLVLGLFSSSEADANKFRTWLRGIGTALDKADCQHCTAMVHLPWLSGCPETRESGLFDHKICDLATTRKTTPIAWRSRKFGSCGVLVSGNRPNTIGIAA